MSPASPASPSIPRLRCRRRSRAHSSRRNPKWFHGAFVPGKLKKTAVRDRVCEGDARLLPNNILWIIENPVSPEKFSLMALRSGLTSETPAYRPALVRQPEFVQAPF